MPRRLAGRHSRSGPRFQRKINVAAAGAEPLGLRIGIHSGTAVVGNIGAAGRLNYTLIGDTVNVAQRLEALGKELDVRETEIAILVSGDTAARLGARFEVRPLGGHQLRGRRAATEVFELLGEGAAGGPVEEIS